MKKLVLHYLGGLGNQLFSYAIGISLAKKYKRKLILDLEDFYNGYPDPSYLDRLNIGDYVELRNLLPHAFIKIVLKIIRHFFIVREKKEFFYQKIEETELLNYAYIDGYWQSEKYFEDNKELISNIFRLKKADDEKLSLLVQKYDMHNKIAVHIRRGDYVGGGRLCNDEYYEKALNIMESKTSDNQYAVFSDDIEYAKNMSCFRNRNCIFIERKQFVDDLISLYAMSACKHQIIVNSTYSWWAAWLNTNEEKIVIAPELPYLKDSDFYPVNWIKIDSNCC